MLKVGDSVKFKETPSGHIPDYHYEPPMFPQDKILHGSMYLGKTYQRNGGVIVYAMENVSSNYYCVRYTDIDELPVQLFFAGRDLIKLSKNNPSVKLILNN